MPRWPRLICLVLLFAVALLVVTIHVTTFWSWPAVGADDTLFALSSLHFAAEGQLRAPEVQLFLPWSDVYAYWNPVGYALLNSLGYVLLGPVQDMLRVSSLIAYVLSFSLLYRLAWLLDFSRIWIFLCGICWLADPLVVRASHAPRPELWGLVFHLAALVTLLEVSRRRFRYRWLILSGACAGLGIAHHPVGAIWFVLGIGVIFIHERGLTWKRRFSWFAGFAIALWPFLMMVLGGSWQIFTVQLADLMRLLGTSNEPVAMLSHLHQYQATFRPMMVITIISIFGLVAGCVAHSAWYWFTACQVLIGAYVWLSGQEAAWVMLTPGIYLGFFEALRYVWRLKLPWRRFVYVVTFSLLMSFAVSRGVAMLWVQTGMSLGDHHKNVQTWRADVQKHWNGGRPSLMDSELAHPFGLAQVVNGGVNLYDKRWPLDHLGSLKSGIWGTVMGLEPMPPSVLAVVTRRYDLCLEELPHVTDANKVMRLFHSGDQCVLLDPSDL